MREEVFRMERVTRTEHGIVKLEDFQLQIYKGEILGLIPINAHGLRSFLELLQTNLPIDRGYIYYGNELINSWKESRKKNNRITVIKAQSSLVEGLTVADNIFVLRQGFRQSIVRTSLLRKQLMPFLKDIEMDISPDSYVEKLSVFERVVVEILRAVILGHQLSVLNEVSTLISEDEMYKLHKIILRYAQRGISFLYISPHFEEIAMICDRAALLSHGRIQKIIRGEEMSLDSLSGYIREYDGLVRKHLKEENKKNGFRELVLSMRGVSFGALSRLDLDVYAGECVVLQSLDQDIFHDFIRLLTDVGIPEEGFISMNGKSAEIMGNNSIAVVQEYATTSMIFQEMDYLSNLCMGLARRVPDIWRKHGIRESIMKEYGPVLGEDVFCMSIDELSQYQKYQLVYTRILLQHPKVVFCIQPFIGADLPHRMYVWKLLEMLMKKGIAVVILTMNLSDSISLAERLLRIGREGITEEIPRKDFGTLTNDVPWKYLYEEHNRE